jgi:hypothetical protein
MNWESRPQDDLRKVGITSMTKDQFTAKYGDVLAIEATGARLSTYTVLSIGPTGAAGDFLKATFGRARKQFGFIDQGTFDAFVNQFALEAVDATPEPAAADLEPAAAGDESAAPEATLETAALEEVSPEDADAGVEEGSPNAAFVVEEDEDELETAVLVTAYLEVDDSIAEAGIHEVGPYVIGLDADYLKNPSDDIDDLLLSIKDWSVANGHGSTLYFLFEGDLEGDDLFDIFTPNQGDANFVQSFGFEGSTFSVLSLEF